MVFGKCLRLGLADEVCHSILPILKGHRNPFFGKLDRDILQLTVAEAYKNGMAELRSKVRGHRGG